VKVSNVCVLVLAVTLLNSSLFAAEGVLVVQKNTIGGRVRTGQLQIERDRMRTDIESPTGQKQIVMFDGPKQVLTIVYVDRKAYSEFTKADADQIGLQISPAVREQMAKMPPDQRTSLEAMLQGRSATTPPVKMEYRKTGTDKVSKWTCDKYEGFQANVKKMEICTVPAKTLGVTPGDFDIAKQMAAFFAKMSPAAPAATTLEIGTPETVGFSGVPVRTIGYGSKGEVVYTSEVVDITRQNFPASTYEVPAGFQKQAPFAGRGAKP
jgi:hypothetical protein